MTIHFSEKAVEWLKNYHGSIDSTALLLAFDAGQREGQRWAAHVHDMSATDCEFFERPTATAPSTERESMSKFTDRRTAQHDPSDPEFEGSGDGSPDR